MASASEKRFRLVEFLSVGEVDVTLEMRRSGLGDFSSEDGVGDMFTDEKIG
jgi:hypothetical protein